MMLPIIPETHQHGSVSMENAIQIAGMDLMNCDFGLQTHDDGRVWVCINGIAFLRFKPKKQA